jgi:four helix bundle protein
MSMKSFEDSIAWQKAMDLNVVIDEALQEQKNWSFRDQFFRASLSICNNIAEGYEMPTKPHRLKYLYIAKGSCNEVRSMIILAQRRGYFPSHTTDQMRSLQTEVSKLLKAYIANTAGPVGKFPGGMALIFIWLKLSTPFVAIS